MKPKYMVTGSKTSKIHLSDNGKQSLCGLKMSHEISDDFRDALIRTYGLCKHCERK